MGANDGWCAVTVDTLYLGEFPSAWHGQGFRNTHKAETILAVVAVIGQSLALCEELDLDAILVVVVDSQIEVWVVFVLAIVGGRRRGCLASTVALGDIVHHVRLAVTRHGRDHVVRYFAVMDFIRKGRRPTKGQQRLRSDPRVDQFDRVVFDHLSNSGTLKGDAAVLEEFGVFVFPSEQRARQFVGVRHVNGNLANLRGMFQPPLFDEQVPKHENIWQNFRGLGCRSGRPNELEILDILGPGVVHGAVSCRLMGGYRIHPESTDHVPNDNRIHNDIGREKCLEFVADLDPVPIRKRADHDKDQVHVGKNAIGIPNEHGSKCKTDLEGESEVSVLEQNNENGEELLEYRQ